MENLGQREREILEHMLAAGRDVKRSSKGYRNYYCAEVGSIDHGQLMQMVLAGLVVEGRKINEGCDQYFFATLKGCRAIGMDPKAIGRAMAND